MGGFTCMRLGGHPAQETCGSSGETCERWMGVLINSLGTPPQGAYYWAKSKTWELELCYDVEIPEHLAYATKVADGRPATWEE